MSFSTPTLVGHYSLKQVALHMLSFARTIYLRPSQRESCAQAPEGPQQTGITEGVCRVSAC